MSPWPLSAADYSYIIEIIQPTETAMSMRLLPLQDRTLIAAASRRHPGRRTRCGQAGVVPGATSRRRFAVWRSKATDLQFGETKPPVVPSGARALHFFQNLQNTKRTNYGKRSNIKQSQGIDRRADDDACGSMRAHPRLPAPGSISPSTRSRISAKRTPHGKRNFNASRPRSAGVPPAFATRSRAQERAGRPRSRPSWA